MDMGTALVSLVEYLDTAYSPDREYVDGAIVERHVGERTLSLAQKNVVIYLQTSYPRLFVWPEQRVPDGSRPAQPSARRVRHLGRPTYGSLRSTAADRDRDPFPA